MNKFKVQKSPFAKKSFGQNFLVDGKYINKIIAALKLKENETIIEIGSGRGALTEGLVESGANVIAVELERDMIAVLRQRFDDEENFRLIEGDALKIDYSEFRVPDAKLKLVANLPYYISTAILQKLIEQRDVFGEMILMFQSEVVERITARVGNSERGFLSVLVQNYLEVDKLFDVPPTAFRPSPKVNSAIVKLTPKSETNVGDEALFREIVSAAFVQKRKTIFNNLKNCPPKLLERIGDVNGLLGKCAVEPSRRAETLTIDEWRGLCEAIDV